MSRVAAVVLGVVLLASGALKVASRTWPRQARELGAPRVAVVAVPALELVLGAMLVAGLATTVAAVGAAVLLVAFTTLLVVRLAQGRRPVCACFGPLSTRPIGWGSVARNLVLLVLALVAA